MLPLVTYRLKIFQNGVKDVVGGGGGVMVLGSSKYRWSENST